MFYYKQMFAAACIPAAFLMVAHLRSLLRLRVSLVWLAFVRMKSISFSLWVFFVCLPDSPFAKLDCKSGDGKASLARRAPVAHPAATPAPPGNAGTQGRVSPVGRSIALSSACFHTPTPSTDEPHADSPCSAGAAFCAAVCRNQGLYWPDRAAHGVDWPTLAEAWGSLARNLALRGASGAPAGRSLRQLVFDIGAGVWHPRWSATMCASGV